MEELDALGLWAGKEQVTADGDVSVIRRPKFKINLKPGGMGKLKFGIIPIPIKWEATEQGVALINVSDGHREHLVLQPDGKMRMYNEDGSATVYWKS